MKYRHSFHAGNFADVHKHVTLLALIAALQRKNKGFLYLETHAGRGLYDLNSADTHQGAEARLGIGALRSAGCESTAIRTYLDALDRARANINANSTGSRRLRRAHRCSRPCHCARRIAASAAKSRPPNAARWNAR